MEIKKVFLSYSHDTPQHKEWVLMLATKLRESGIDAILDQWDLGLGDDLAHFMEVNLKDADRVLMICSDNYVSKANSGEGGVGYEKMIVTSNYMKNINANKVIPIIKNNKTCSVPTFLSTKLYLDFNNERLFSEKLEELIRAIHETPALEKPVLGSNPFKTSIKNIIEDSGKMTKNKYFDILFSHSKKNNWTFNDEYDKINDLFLDIAILNEDLDIKIEYGRIHEKNFIETWANEWPDPKASSYYVDFYYNSTKVDSYVIVCIDGFRGKILLPSMDSNGDYYYDSFHYDLAIFLENLFSVKDKTVDMVINRFGFQIK